LKPWRFFVSTFYDQRYNMKRLNYSWELPQSIVERLGPNTYGSQRNIFEEDNLLIILHSIPATEGNEREHKVFWIRPDQEMWCNGQSNGKFELHALLETYQKEFEALEFGIDKAKKAKEFFELLEVLVPIHRAMKNLAKTLKESRTILEQNSYILEMRDWAVDLQRNYEVLLADGKLALEFRIAQKTEEQVEKASHALSAQNKLNTIAAFTFPMMALAAVFGMNLVHGLENKSVEVFWGVLLGGIVIGFLVRKWLFKKA
jgi:Mg2+ and Co2+ transporter CorA